LALLCSRQSFLLQAPAHPPDLHSFPTRRSSDLIASVVERPAAQFPGIEMRAEDDHFVGLFVAPNFADYVLLLDGAAGFIGQQNRSEEHTSELQSHLNLVCRLLLEKKNTQTTSQY